MTQKRKELFRDALYSGRNTSKLPQALFLSLMLMISAAGFAQTEADFPAGNFWALDGGLGWGGLLEEGQSVEAVIEPKLWLSPALEVGIRAGMSFSWESGAPNPDPLITSDALFFDAQAFMRWNFLRLGDNVNRKVNLFAQAGLGLTAVYRGTDNSFDNPEGTRGSVLADAALGVTFPMTDRWHIEGSVHGGYPHMFGVSLTAGYKFKLPEKTEGRTEIRTEVKTEYVEVEKVKSISVVQFILFGPSIGVYNLGVDHNGQSLNNLVIGEVAYFLKTNPEYLVHIEGNANPVTTDPGEATILMELSTTRSNSVAAELEKQGVPRDKMLIMSFGGTRTITRAHDRWDMNRRVELVIMNGETAAELTSQQQNAPQTN